MFVAFFSFLNCIFESVGFLFCLDFFFSFVS